MNQIHLEINCDLGEGIAHESEIIPFIDAASVACGGHYGNEETIQKTISACASLGKKVGAHPSYPDRENFGRKSLSISTVSLLDSIHRQIELFLKVANATGAQMDHIKFHGALYNDAAAKPDLAQALCEFISENYPSTSLFVPPHSTIEQIAKEIEMPIRLEIFGDRAYTDALQLVSRNDKNAVFTDFESISSHLNSILENSQIKTQSGKLIPIHAETICFHGDNPGILSFLPQVRKRW
ncbi:lactam utilization protein LamB [Algoriphagus kandeliae]|uniref:Lactam utilization protein LamB n=1 Tax=Algoriphagus kandeliae TaxID=2562278 RepID=A0A4Y9QI48_9BACT|nr:LamB/YcsF family protein [Algoriphagus kandeliae]TFV92341.1 lactam utilization protein LamB [Algoriphagus kandeliae]